MGKGVSRAEVRQTADNVMRTQIPPLLPWVKVPWLNIFRTALLTQWLEFPAYIRVVRGSNPWQSTTRMGHERLVETI